MGNIQNLLMKVYSESSPNSSTFFQQQMQNYSKQKGKRCLQKMIDIQSIGISNSLKKIYKYLHPALKYIIYCKQQSLHCLQQKKKPSSSSPSSPSTQTNNQFEQISDLSLQDNFVMIHEQQLIGSAGIMLQIYCEYLNHVVPANISYFHFMRQKDLYIHYSVLKYILEAGYIGNTLKSSNKNTDIFRRLKSETRRFYTRLISHWLYDMIKYRCSAIYIKSSTLQNLIQIHTSVLCGLIVCDRQNSLAGLKTKVEALQVYEHCLFSFLYVLSEAHVGSGQVCLQVAVIAIRKLLENMWIDMGEEQKKLLQKKIMFAPSYWYAAKIGFIHQPRLQKIVYCILIDLLLKKDSQVILNIANSTSQSQYNELIEEYIPENRIQSGNYNSKTTEFHEPKGTLFELKKQKQTQNDQDEKMMEITLQSISVNQNINIVTKALILSCLDNLLQYLGNNLQMQPLHYLLSQLCSQIEPSSYLRPFLLTLHKHLLAYHNNLVILDKITQFCRENRMDYSTKSHIIPYRAVQSRFRYFIKQNIHRILLGYCGQFSKSQGEIWGFLGKIGDTMDR